MGDRYKARGTVSSQALDDSGVEIGGLGDEHGADAAGSAGSRIRLALSAQWSSTPPAGPPQEAASRAATEPNQIAQLSSEPTGSETTLLFEGAGLAEVSDPERKWCLGAEVPNVNSQVGSLAAVSRSDDDEFSYAEGEQRQGPSHKQVSRIITHS